VTLRPDATHDFDDPRERRQAVPANRAAKADAVAKVAGLVDGMK
jgi:carboxymethylenebutenolidase